MKSALLMESIIIIIIIIITWQGLSLNRMNRTDATDLETCFIFLFSFPDLIK